jgi:hypothetical protein
MEFRQDVFKCGTVALAKSVECAEEYIWTVSMPTY